MISAARGTPDGRIGWSDAVRLGNPQRIPGAARVPEAIGLLDRLTHADDLAEFLTLPAYESID